MKCNRARIISKQKEKMIKEIATKAAEQQLDDAITRTDQMWQAAIINAGLSCRTLERIKKELVRVEKEFEKFKEDGVADFALRYGLESVGVTDLKETKNEM